MKLPTAHPKEKEGCLQTNGTFAELQNFERSVTVIPDMGVMLPIMHAASIITTPCSIFLESKIHANSTV
jgi:hypothetical protein